MENFKERAHAATVAMYKLVHKADFDSLPVGHDDRVLWPDLGATAVAASDMCSFIAQDTPAQKH